MGADWALLSSPENVTYVSHYEVPIDYVTQPGDIAELDINPRINGYWADMANTMEPTAIPKTYARAARESFYAGVSKARLGNRARYLCRG